LGFSPHQHRRFKKQFSARVMLSSGGSRIALKNTFYYDNIEKYDFGLQGSNDQNHGILSQKKQLTGCGAPRIQGGTYVTTGGSRSAHISEMDEIDVKSGGTSVIIGDLDHAFRSSGSATDCQAMVTVGGRDATFYTAHIDKFQFEDGSTIDRWGNLAIIAEQTMSYGNDLAIHMDRGLLIGFNLLPRYHQFKCWADEGNTTFFPTFYDQNVNGHVFVANSQLGLSYGGSFATVIRELDLKTISNGHVTFGDLTVGPLNSSGGASEFEVMNTKGVSPNIFAALDETYFFCFKTRGQVKLHSLAG